MKNLMLKVFIEILNTNLQLVLKSLFKTYHISKAPIDVNPVGGGGGVRARGGDLMPETIPLSGF